jgi:hypothetical protein
VDACITNDLMAVRFKAVGDVRERSPEQVLVELRTMADRNDHERLAGELLAFAHELSPGDIVLTPHKERRRYFLGLVTGTYEWREQSPVPDMHHVRTVDWISYLDWDDVPLEFRSIKYYQRTVLRTEDRTIETACNEAIQEPRGKSDLLSTGTTKRSPAPRARKAAAPRKAAKPAPVPHDKVCSGCHLRKPFSQFSNASDVCVDCE